MLLDYRPEMLDYYLNVERVEFVAGVGATALQSYGVEWAELDRLRSIHRRGHIE